MTVLEEKFTRGVQQYINETKCVVPEQSVNGQYNFASLIEPAKKARVTPDSGVTIINKAAYYVIRDCAEVADKCISFYVWFQFRSCITKENASQILAKLRNSCIIKEEDVKDGLSWYPTRFLFTDIMNRFSEFIEEIKDNTTQKADIYGDYGGSMSAKEDSLTLFLTKYLCQ